MAIRHDPFRDTLIAIGVVAVALLGVYLWSGVYPPMVVVESQSMMHAGDQPYGRFGTVDVGDIIFVQRVHVDDIVTWAQAHDCEKCDSHGMPGHVIVFMPNCDPNRTPIIHRAMAYVQVQGSGANRIYHVEWIGGVVTFNRTGIYLPELGFSEPAFTPQNGYKPRTNGFITKGDNPETNPRADQAGRIALVEADCIIGLARGELPWFGLLKLAISPTFNIGPPPPEGFARIGNAYSTPDTWTMLAISLAILFLIPIVLDIRRARQERREWQEREMQALRDGAPPRWIPPEERTLGGLIKTRLVRLSYALFPPHEEDEPEPAAKKAPSTKAPVRSDKVPAVLTPVPRPPAKSREDAEKTRDKDG